MAGYKKIFVILAIMGALGTVGWWQHKPWLAKYYVKQLEQANEEARAGWVASLVSLDDIAVPPLLAALENADQNSRANLDIVLISLVQSWGPNDERSVNILALAAGRFASLNVPAKKSILQLPIALLRKDAQNQKPASRVIELAEKLFEASANDPNVRVATLQLAGVLVEHGINAGTLDLCRKLAHDGLSSSDGDIRVAAVQLVLRPVLRQDNDLLAGIVPLLKDNVAQVRKTALVALGPARDLVSEEDLLPFLHDPDEEVQNLCELALRRRGLQENHILMARFISDDNPSARLQIFQHLREADDLEPGVWLRRLCQDPSPAVRAAAVRAAISQTQVDMRPCLQEMARQDPSPTVRQLAGYYVNLARSGND